MLTSDRLRVHTTTKREGTDSFHDALANLYACEAAPLERRVAQRVIASSALIEDACSYAWWQLSRNRDRIELDAAARWWLYRVAVRRAWPLTEHDRREVAVGAPDQLPRDPSQDTDPAVVIERRETLRGVEGLPRRQQRLLVSQAAGFSYAEIARLTADSVPTIERQLRLARHQLRQNV